MRISEVVDQIEALGGVLVLRPQPGDGSPPIAWGDVFCYYAPDGVLPRTQPFATVVTKDYPDDAGSRLDESGGFRLNLAVGADEFGRRTEGHLGPADSAVPDVVVAHPVYAAQHWVAVLNPGPASATAVGELIGIAHGLAKQRFERRHEGAG